MDAETGHVVDSSAGTTKVRLPKDFTNTEIPDLAQELVEKCKYIPSSKVNEVKNLMEEMLTKAKVFSRGTRNSQSMPAPGGGAGMPHGALKASYGGPGKGGDFSGTFIYAVNVGPQVRSQLTARSTDTALN